MKFAHPLWLLGALFALALGGLLVLGALSGVRARRRFGQDGLVESLFTARVGSRRALKGALSVLGLICCFGALAQPQYGWGTRRIPATNLDVIIVLDYSKSMFARDVAPNRIERAKTEVADLISQLAGARFGAVAFAGEPLSFPLTSDGGAIAQFFRQLTPHDMPVGGTAIARALEAGRSLLERDPQSAKHRRVMLLVTDGEDLEGDPEQTARAAKDAGISIHVVQIGGRTPEPIPDVDEQGVNRGLRRNENGQVMTTSLSAEGEKQLTQIAEITGGNVVRSEAGSTGIQEVARRLRAMMTEELSERVETVYADVYAYPLGLALLCILLEAFVPEVWRRRSRKAAPGVTAEKSPAPAGNSAQAAASATASVLVLLLACGAFSALLGAGCDSQAVDRAFTRRAPDVDRGIEALEAGDAGAAAQHFTTYLGTGPCNDGSIGVPPTLAQRPQASFDLGLALFKIAERFGGRFGEDQGREEDNPQQLAARSAEVACALSVLEQIVGRRNLPLELTAQAHYLLGNLEFLRREYKAAVSHYNRALELIPGDDAESAQAVGRDAAHNRALALRRAEEDKPKPPQHPDAGPEQGDAGAPQDQPPEHADAGQPSSKGDQNQEQKNQDQNQDQQQPPEQPKDQDSKSPDQQQDQQQQDQQGKNQPAPQQAPEGQEPKQTPPPEQHAMSLSQDDKALDQLERAPTVQQEAARAQRGRTRRVVEDK
ncbi:MAG TPA: VWA domain-containing protein [Polyangiaceae bacterium]|nr:VWA domain-containing protein [Polyangiaceae bacterium]